MSFQYLALSLVGLCTIVILIVKNYEVWTCPKFMPEKILTGKSVPKIESAPAILIQNQSPTNPSQIVVAQKNIFSPERKDFPIPEAKKPIMRPQISLFGVTLADDYQSACVGNSGSAVKKAEGESMTLRVGDKIGEYRLSKISADRITLESMEDSFEVLLYDPAKPKKRIYAKMETKPAAVTTTASSQTFSQEPAKQAQSITPRMLRNQLPQPAPAPPSPSPRSRRAASYTPGASTGSSIGSSLGPSIGSATGSIVGSQTPQ